MAGSEDAAVREASERFYAALNAVFEGDAAPMIALWAHGEEAVFLSPTGGIFAGWEQVRLAWETAAGWKTGSHITPERTVVTVGSDVAVAYVLTRGYNLAPDGSRNDLTMRDTNVFRNIDGTWKMIGHHADLFPFMG